MSRPKSHAKSSKGSGKSSKGGKPGYEPQDAYYHEAKKKGFVARSALKLEELDRKAQFYRKGMRILDLGCAPGSWLQYASRKVGPEGRLFGIDLDPVRVDLSNVTTVVGDIYGLTPEDERLAGFAPFDMIQSDAMTKTTGISESDCARSVALSEYALYLGRRGLLKNGGSFVCKVFEGSGFTEFFLEMKKAFRKASVHRPEAIRPGSREVYVVGAEFRESNTLAAPPKDD